MSNMNGSGSDAGNGPTGGNSGPGDPVRHGWFCPCIYCLIGASSK